MDSFSNSDSEFDSGAEEAEFRLYAELYFGEQHARPSGKNPVSEYGSPTSVHLDKTSVDPLNNNVVENININEEKDIVDNNGHFAKHLGLSTTRSIDSATIDNLVGNGNINNTKEINICPNLNRPTVNSNSLNDYGNKETEYFTLPVTGTSARRRNISICSTDSISGKEPLDNLYCNYDLETSIINEIPVVSLDPIEEESLSNEEESRYCIKTSKSKNRKNNKNMNAGRHSCSSSDEEICILPPDPPKLVEILTLDSDRSNMGLVSESEESVQIVLNSPCKPSKSNRKRKNTAKPKNSKKSKNKRAISPISLSSDSEDSECEFLEATNSPMTSLTINLRRDKNNRNTTFVDNTPLQPNKKQILSFAKSQVIFSKSRALTKRMPSCSKWTLEMSSMYDSDISEDYDVEKIHDSQSDEAIKWKIISEDYPVRFRKRYFNNEMRCRRCKDVGHHISKCPRIPHCLYCSSPKHVQVRHCPGNCCLKCGEEAHFFCRFTIKQMICNICSQYGHHAKLCPDLWRRFHATTSGSIPVKPTKDKKKKKRIAYCYNCAKAGHYGHECTSLSNSPKYSFVSTLVFNYSPVSMSPYYRPIDYSPVSKSPYYRPIDYSSVSKSPYYRPIDHSPASITPSYAPIHSFTAPVLASVAESSPMVTSNKKCPILTRELSFAKSEVKEIICKDKLVAKEITARSGARLRSVVDKKHWKVTILGSIYHVQDAERMLNALIGKIPSDGYLDLVSKIRDAEREMGSREKPKLLPYKNALDKTGLTNQGSSHKKIKGYSLLASGANDTGSDLVVSNVASPNKRLINPAHCKNNVSETPKRKLKKLKNQFVGDGSNVSEELTPVQKSSSLKNSPKKSLRNIGNENAVLESPANSIKMAKIQKPKRKSLNNCTALPLLPIQESLTTKSLVTPNSSLGVFGNKNSLIESSDTSVNVSRVKSMKISLGIAENLLSSSKHTTINSSGKVLNESNLVESPKGSIKKNKLKLRMSQLSGRLELQMHQKPLVRCKSHLIKQLKMWDDIGQVRINMTNGSCVCAETTPTLKIFKSKNISPENEINGIMTGPTKKKLFDTGKASSKKPKRKSLNNCTALPLLPIQESLPTKSLVTPNSSYWVFGNKNSLIKSSDTSVNVSSLLPVTTPTTASSFPKRFLNESLGIAGNLLSSSKHTTIFSSGKALNESDLVEPPKGSIKKNKIQPGKKSLGQIDSLLPVTTLTTASSFPKGFVNESLVQSEGHLINQLIIRDVIAQVRAKMANGSCTSVETTPTLKNFKSKNISPKNEINGIMTDPTKKELSITGKASSKKKRKNSKKTSCTLMRHDSPTEASIGNGPALLTENLAPDFFESLKNLNSINSFIANATKSYKERLSKMKNKVLC